jgi:hypothetical protein
MTRSNRIILNGKEFSLFKDYSLKQRDDLRALPMDDKLRYLEERARLVFLDALDEWLSLLNSKCLSSFHELNMVTLVCCAIEGLGHYLTGDDNAGDAFRRFIGEFMPAFSPVQNELWNDFRNGLAHGFCIKHGGIEKNLCKPFMSDGEKGIKLDFDIFVSDFKTAFDNFFKKLETEKEKFEENFTARFKEVLID